MLNVAIVDYYLWTIIVDYYLWTIIVDYYLWTINVDYYWWHSQGFSRVMHQRSCTRGKLFCKRNNHPYELSSSLGCLSDIKIEHQWMILKNDFYSVAACLWSVFCHAELFIYFSIWLFRAWFNFFLQYIIANKKKWEHTLKKRLMGLPLTQPVGSYITTLLDHTSEREARSDKEKNNAF